VIVPDGVDEKASRSREGVPDPRRTRLLVKKGQVVEPGDALHEGSISPADLLRLKGYTATSVTSSARSEVYKSQGVEIHDSIIELIVRRC